MGVKPGPVDHFASDSLGAPCVNLRLSPAAAQTYRRPLRLAAMASAASTA